MEQRTKLQGNLERGGFDSELQKASETGALNSGHTLAVVPNGQHAATVDDMGNHMTRQMQARECWLIIVIIIYFLETPDGIVLLGWAMIAVQVTITSPVSGTITYDVEGTVDTSTGVMTLDITLEEEDQINDDGSGLCDECSATFMAGDCLDGDCVVYDEATTNEQMEVRSTVRGDIEVVPTVGSDTVHMG